MTVVHDITTKICNTCGREISILHPDHWAYKRKLGNVNIFWCSWSCLREAEKEGKFSMKKLTLDNKKHAVKIAMDGGNPLEYIRMCGISNAADCWSKIKADLKEKDPDTWEKLPKRLPNPVMDKKKEKAEEAPADEVTKAAMQHPERPIVSPISPVVVEIPEAPKDVCVLAMKPMPAVKSVKHTDFEISAIRNSLGEFYFDKKYNAVDWRTIEGEEVSLSPAAWRELAEVVPDVLTVLGVGSCAE